MWLEGQGRALEEQHMGQSGMAFGIGTHVDTKLKCVESRVWSIDLVGPYCLPWQEQVMATHFSPNWDEQVQLVSQWHD